jgi:hypothetical protein
MKKNLGNNEKNSKSVQNVRRKDKRMESEESKT